MTQPNYEGMSAAELRQYFLAHRDDPEALQAYLARVNQEPRSPIATGADPDFDAKIQAAVRQRLKRSE